MEGDLYASKIQSFWKNMMFNFAKNLLSVCHCSELQGCWKVLSPTRKETNNIPRILWNLEVRYHIRKGPPPVPTLAKSVHSSAHHTWQAQLVSFLVGLMTYEHPGTCNCNFPGCTATRTPWWGIHPYGLQQKATPKRSGEEDFVSRRPHDRLGLQDCYSWWSENSCCVWWREEGKDGHCV